MSDNDPSLLDDMSLGGGNAQSGFLYQDAYVIGSIPRWLAADGFTQVKQEGIDDVETFFFVPGRGIVHELVQVKNQNVNASGLKKVIKRFVDLERSGNFAAFKIVAPNYAKRVRPLRNALIKLKIHYGDHEGNSIGNRSMSDFEVRAQKLLDADAEICEFLIKKVDLCVASDEGDGAFRNDRSRFFPGFRNSLARVTDDGLSRLRHIVHVQKLGSISRKMIEECLYEVDDAPSLPPIRIAFQHGGTGPQRPLVFDWNEYFDFDKQRYPSIQDWNEILLPQLKDTLNQIKQFRKARTVRMQKHAISSALAFGSVFSAVAGFEIEIEHNGEIWYTSARSSDITTDYDCYVDSNINPESKHLVVSIGIMKDIAANVEPFLYGANLQQASRLHIVSQQPIVSSEQANEMVNNLKRTITDTIQALRAHSTIHLFYAGPVHFAAFLGHRLNATAPVQCYEWNNISRCYLRACRIFA